LYKPPEKESVYAKRGRKEIKLDKKPMSMSKITSYHKSIKVSYQSIKGTGRREDRRGKVKPRA
jgi:hypothetical protein